LNQRAVEDEDVCAQALDLLAGDPRWAELDETLAARQLYVERWIRDGATSNVRGQAAFRHIGSAGRSDPLADAKKRVFSQDVDGVGPFLDPLEPVSDEHLAKVARRANLSDQQLDEMVEQINAEFGWDIRRGLTE